MSIEESKRIATKVMVEIQNEEDIKAPYPKKHLDRIAGAIETVFTYNNIFDEDNLVDALILEDIDDDFASCVGFDELQKAVNKYRNSL